MTGLVRTNIIVWLRIIIEEWVLIRITRIIFTGYRGGFTMASHKNDRSNIYKSEQKCVVHEQLNRHLDTTLPSANTS